MAGYYIVKILKINEAEASVKMHVRMFNPDGSRIYDSVGFGLQLLNNGKWDGSLINEEISFDDLLAPDWCQKYANGFVKAVVKVDGKKVVPPENDNDKEDPDYEPVDPLPTATMTIFCTDTAWLAHLSEGEEWESYAYEVARQYDACAPILFNRTSEEDTIPSDEPEGWMPVPSFLFDQGSHRLPKVLFIPKFTESSYVVKEATEYSPIDHSTLLKLHGKYIKDVKHNTSGIFVWDDGFQMYKLYNIGRNTRGGHNYYNIKEIEKIGLLTLKPNFNRHAKFLNHSDIFRMANPVIKGIQRQGKAVTLEVTGIYDIDKLGLNKARVLKLICNNFVETHGYEGEMDSEFPLSKLLKYFAQKEENSARGVLSKIADGIILKYSYDYPDEYIKDYDEMDVESLVQYFEKEEWPCFKIHIELSDESFGLQLDHVLDSSRQVPLSFVPEDIDNWEQPILWKDYQELMK